MALFNQTHCSLYVVFEVCNKLKTVEIVDLRWGVGGRLDGKDQICKLQGHEAGRAQCGRDLYSPSNMLTRRSLIYQRRGEGQEMGGWGHWSETGGRA